MTPLQLILSILDTAASVAAPMLAGNPTASKIDSIAAGLVSIVRAATEAHLAITGKPIDLTLLQPIEPIP